MSNLSRQELINYIHSYYERIRRPYINHSLFTNEELIIAYETIINRKLYDKYEYLSGWAIYMALIHIDFSENDENEMINKGISKYNNEWCIYYKSIKNYDKINKRILLLEQIVDIIPFACRDLAQSYIAKNINSNKIIYLYGKYLQYIKDKIILNDEINIPGCYLFDALNCCTYGYDTSRKYNKISSILKEVILINGLIDIIMQYY